MEEGEKYLNIKIVGHDYIAAFPNKEKKNDNEPDFKGNGVAIWVRKKGDSTKKETAEELLGDVTHEKVGGEK